MKLRSIALLAIVTSISGIGISSFAQPKQSTKTQQFALLIYETRANFASRNGSDQKEYWAAWTEYAKELNSAGIVTGGSAFQLPETAHVVRAKSVKTGSVESGREELGGFFTIQVESLDEAKKWAAKSPSTKMGGAVEIRPLLPMAPTK